MQNDEDFDYSSDDQSAPSPQTKDSTSTSLQKITKTASVTGIRGEEVKLQCDVGSESEYSHTIKNFLQITNKKYLFFSA